MVPAGRHSLCLPALSAEKRNGRRLSMARSVHLDHCLPLSVLLSLWRCSLKSAVFRSIFLALDLGKLRIFEQKPL